MQIIDLQSNPIWVNKFVNMRKLVEDLESHRSQNVESECFMESKILEAWNSMPDTFYSVKKLAISLLTIFSSTYSCESLFSVLNHVHSKTRNRLTEEDSAACITLQSTMYQPDIKTLANASSRDLANSDSIKNNKNGNDKDINIYEKTNITNVININKKNYTSNNEITDDIKKSSKDLNTDINTNTAVSCATEISKYPNEEIKGQLKVKTLNKYFNNIFKMRKRSSSNSNDASYALAPNNNNSNKNSDIIYNNDSNNNINTANICYDGITQTSIKVLIDQDGLPTNTQQLRKIYENVDIAILMEVWVFDNEIEIRRIQNYEAIYNCRNEKRVQREVILTIASQNAENDESHNKIQKMKKNNVSVSIIQAITMNKRIQTFVESIIHYDTNQYDLLFDPNIERRCTDSAVTVTLDHIFDVLNEGYTAGIFIDLSKAFDVVNYSGLLDFLEYLGIRGTANSLLRSYLLKRVHCVRINKTASTELLINTGVPQADDNTVNNNWVSTVANTNLATVTRKRKKKSINNYISKEWINKELISAVESKHYWYSKFKGDGANRNVERNFKYYRNIYTKLRRIKKEKYYEWLFRNSRNDSAKTWNCINKILYNSGKNYSVLELLRDTSELEAVNIIDELNVHFATVAEKLINALKKTKSIDLHDMTSNMLKFCIEHLREPLATIINESLNEGVVLK
ncbi:homeobox protein 3-like [Condylostylus longicornis]|uniref:homeobox protein 3-like n=1 Tax=Condylostylus longicornis TaxID=2530218 RepID=UPI00244E3E42|nr:homeobox protein 3-like [Condylostylus longicornis]